jgi:hypothetical protein
MDAVITVKRLYCRMQAASDHAASDAAAATAQATQTANVARDAYAAADAAKVCMQCLTYSINGFI